MPKRVRPHTAPRQVFLDRLGEHSRDAPFGLPWGTISLLPTRKRCSITVSDRSSRSRRWQPERGVRSNDPTTRKRERPSGCRSRPSASHRPPTRLSLNLNSKCVDLFHQQVDHVCRDAQLVFGDLAPEQRQHFHFLPVLLSYSPSRVKDGVPHVTKIAQKLALNRIGSDVEHACNLWATTVLPEREDEDHERIGITVAEDSTFQHAI